MDRRCRTKRFADQFSKNRTFTAEGFFDFLPTFIPTSLLGECVIVRTVQCFWGVG